VDEVLSLCARVEINGEIIFVQPERDAERRRIADGLNGQGFRVIALAYKEMPNATDEPVYSVKDEADLILLGFLAFSRSAQGYCCGSIEAAWQPWRRRQGLDRR